jgi:hypothetical protein
MSNTEEYTPSLEDLLVLQEAGDDPVNIDDLPSIQEGEETPPPTDDLEDNTRPIPEPDEFEEEEEETPDIEEEEEEEEIEKKAPDTTSTSEEELEFDENALTQQYEFLRQQQILLPNEDFEFDGTAESLEEAYAQTRQNVGKLAFQSLMERLPKDYQDALRYLQGGNANLKDFARAYYSDIDYDKFDVSTDENQRAVLRDYYQKTTKFDDNRIERMITKLEDSGEMLLEAEDALQYMKANQEEERQQRIKMKEEEDRKMQEAMVERQRELATAIQESSSVSGRRKNSLKAFLMNPSEINGEVNTDFNRKLGAITQNPEHFVQLADLLMDYDPKQGFNFSRYEKKGSSKATSKFQEELNKTLKGLPKGGKQKNKNPNDDKVSWEEVMKQLEI